MSTSRYPSFSSCSRSCDLCAKGQASDSNSVCSTCMVLQDVAFGTISKPDQVYPDLLLKVKYRVVKEEHSGYDSDPGEKTKSTETVTVLRPVLKKFKQIDFTALNVVKTELALRILAYYERRSPNVNPKYYVVSAKLVKSDHCNLRTMLDA